MNDILYVLRLKLAQKSKSALLNCYKRRRDGFKLLSSVEDSPIPTYCQHKVYQLRMLFVIKETTSRCAIGLRQFFARALIQKVEPGCHTGHKSIYGSFHKQKILWF